MRSKSDNAYADEAVGILRLIYFTLFAFMFTKVFTSSRNAI